jgi:hypothetical protein
LRCRNDAEDHPGFTLPSVEHRKTVQLQVRVTGRADDLDRDHVPAW